MWENNPNPLLVALRDEYLHQYAALPTNTQFVERGVKESGYVTLGRRCESNRTILAIARGKDLPEALANGHQELHNENGEEEKRRYQLKGKRKTIELMKSINSHNKDMSCMINSCTEKEFSNKRRRVKEALTDPSAQFKKERIIKKVDAIKQSYSNNPAPNRFQRREGYTLTPLLEGKIQYGKMKKKDNMDAVRDELKARMVGFRNEIGWKEIITLL